MLLLVDKALSFLPVFWVVFQVEPTSLSNAIMRVVIATILVACVGFGVALWLSRRHGPKTTSTSRNIGGFLSRAVSQGEIGTLEIVQRVRVGPSQSLLHVTWFGEDILIGCTPQSLSLLRQGKVANPVSVSQSGASQTS